MARQWIACVLVLLCVGAQANNFAHLMREAGADQHLKSFMDLQKLTGRVYKDADEFAYRFSVYRDNAARVEEMNKLDPDAEYRLNEFADLTEEEFATRYLGASVDFSTAANSNLPALGELPTDDLPANFDWRDKGALTPVKNQGQCGSCWAFATTASVESANFIKNGELVSLSEQQLVDCDKECADPQTCDSGCGGGLPDLAMTYIKKNGITSEQAYPYEGKDRQCRAESKPVAARLSGFSKVSQDEQQIAAALVAKGPLAIGINAVWMQFYFGGISNPIMCSPQKLDHAVVIVGYGNDKGKDYWTIRNSWGPSWGEKGHYRIIRGKGKCGVNQYVVAPEA
eukprot:GILI01001000.1.p1 GENE.GILI01001000.1~~GILI01001000.1.p1  ORF type:complete len:348 (-),score=126.50 GILI01001000.1:296-1318(-)